MSTHSDTQVIRVSKHCFPGVGDIEATDQGVSVRIDMAYQGHATAAASLRRLATYIDSMKQTTDPAF